MRKILKFCFNTTAWSPSRSEWLALLSSLPKEERERTTSYMFKRDSKQTLIGQALIRYCIKCFLNTDWQNICIGRNSKNRPFLKLKETLCLSQLKSVDFVIDFNVSHSGDYTIIIAGMFPTKKKADDLEESPKLGSDVMKIDITRSKIRHPNESDEFLFQHQLELFERVVESKFSNAEKAYIHNRPNPVERLTAFYRLWSLKESYVKAQGDGIGFDIKRIECIPRSDLLFDLNSKKGLVIEDTQILVDSKLVKNCRFYEQYFMYSSDSVPNQYPSQRPHLHIMTHCIIESDKSIKDRKDADQIGEFVEIGLNDILKDLSYVENIEEFSEFEEMWKGFSQKDEKPVDF
ncbi:L-aminoadipate-semialdehyde dehydrogenase-phosphopantetheinyl transferase [Brachionus plicatilis]|uniref:L-aminoadipate-semialdehyde dehydrogenase-phosphopantetheinyl transferase n=1 Tax=Brachionus plicatilis TaxID=10195 RepID=A0A3M7SUI5_BRAPC|nr:L-aminoadipate-semialdehyde dehydrogenase-phosphopantetheinyl transferase [Brachionus plicatilis]